MSILKPVALAVMASLIATPAAAKPATNPAAKLTLTPKAPAVRTPTPVRKSEKLGGSFALIVLGTAAIVGLAVAMGSHDSKSASM
jgi:hypothetical protein